MSMSLLTARRPLDNVLRMWYNERVVVNERRWWPGKPPREDGKKMVNWRNRFLWVWPSSRGQPSPKSSLPLGPYPREPIFCLGKEWEYAGPWQGMNYQEIADAQAAQVDTWNAQLAAEIERRSSQAEEDQPE